MNLTKYASMPITDTISGTRIRWGKVLPRIARDIAVYLVSPFSLPQLLLKLRCTLNIRLTTTPIVPHLPVLYSGLYNKGYPRACNLAVGVAISIALYDWYLPYHILIIAKHAGDSFQLQRALLIKNLLSGCASAIYMAS
jgi:hypothetical protein